MRVAAREQRGVALAVAAMATRFELVLPGADEARLRAVGELALEELLDCERRFDRYDRASLLALVNREAARRAVRVDGDTFELLERCLELRHATGGAFDVTMGEWTDAQRDGRSAAARGDLDAREHGLALDPAASTVRFARPGTSLDLGGIAKGHALDLAAAVLRAHGVASALLHGGTSTVLAIGAPPGADGWRVAIGREGAPPVALLRDAALSVSAVHGRRDVGGGAHVLDPASGVPVDECTPIAAVIDASARTADAWSTALVAGARVPSGLCALLARRDERGELCWQLSGQHAPSSCFELTFPHPEADSQLPA